MTDPVLERAREMAISAYPTLYAALMRQSAEPEMCECGEYELVAVDCCDLMRCEGATVMVLDGAGEPDVRVCRDGSGCGAEMEVGDE